MSFKVNKIAAAVAVSLGTSVVGMNVAQADEILFPSVGVSATVTTILSVINDDEVAAGNLHYRYYYKNALTGGGAPNTTGVCQEADYLQATSRNDIVTFDVSGHFGDAKGVLFEPTGSARYNKSFAIFKGLPATRAFAIVDNNTAFTAGNALYGEVFAIEFTGGSVWGYQAYNSAEILGTDAAGDVVVGNPYDFSDRVENDGEVLVPTPTDANPDNYWVPIAIMPWSGNVQTALFVTPIATTAPYQLSGSNTATVALAVNDPANPAFDVMYDRDENPYSGAVPAPVTCVGRLNVPDLISTATRQFVQDSGGWSNVGILAGQATVLKLEYNDTAPADLDGQPTGSASWNNGFWLRQGIRESVARTAVPGSTVKYMPVFDIPRGQTLNSPYPLIDITKTTADLPFPPVYGAPALPYIAIASTVQ